MKKCKQLRLVTDGTSTWIEYDQESKSGSIAVIGIDDGAEIMKSLANSVDSWIPNEAPAEEKGLQNNKTNPLAKRCPMCGKEFVPNIHRQICCSDECRRKRRNNYKKVWSTRMVCKPTDRHCIVCGKKIENSQSHKYCSLECMAKRPGQGKEPNEKMPAL